MSSQCQLAGTIGTLTKKLAEMSLPEDTDEVVELVKQQQQLLEAYVCSTASVHIDPILIRGVLAENHQLFAKARQAHIIAANELDALTVARSALTAYETSP